MKIQKILKDYFTFTRKERIASIVLIVVILGIFFLPKLVNSFTTKQKPAADTSWMQTVAALRTEQTTEENTRYEKDDNPDQYTYQKTTGYTAAAKGELFEFDPNTLSAEGWVRLGVKEKTVHTIQNYLSKGGHFYKPEDVKKIYGMYDDLYERLAPYIRITAANTNTETRTYTPSAQKPEYTKTNRTVDLNNADTTALIALPGIGSKLAFRIINFRDKLGGFYSIEQVKETYGLPDSTFQKIKPFLQLKNTEVHKFNINTATKDELKVHPYIKWNLANAIVEYRNQHGNYNSIEDLKKITIITDDVYQKIAPYFTL